MNIFMNHVAATTFSFFDTGTHPLERSQPEKFYHGLVLGLISELRDTYEIKSNRESGYGRYDVMLIPLDLRDSRLNTIVLELCLNSRCMRRPRKKRFLTRRRRHLSR
jgi:hypothetical protein